MCILENLFVAKLFWNFGIQHICITELHLSNS